MSDNLPWVRKLQKHTIKAAKMASTKTSEAAGHVADGLTELDKRFEITEKAKSAGARAGATVQRINSQHDVSGKARKAKDAISAAQKRLTDGARNIAEETRLEAVVATAGTALKTHIAAPAARAMENSGFGDAVRSVGGNVEQAYGQVRSVIKPYFAPENGAELLRSTKRELAHISACIMQIRANEAQQLASQFGTAVASKLTGAAATGTLLALVSTFGTASTGTAIASLSGAAAANATLAWVGGLVGGGMAAGAVLTGGLAFVVGLAAYQVLGSERRGFDSLSGAEQGIVQACWLLIAAIEELEAGRPLYLNKEIAEGLLHNSLRPLQESLDQHANDICANLDTKHSVAFRQHVLIDFERVVLAGFGHLLAQEGADWSGEARERHDEYVIGGVFYALLTRTKVGDDVESQLVLDALRRSTSSLHVANEAQLSDYLHQYDTEQLKGIAVNVKGIYHEVLWVHRYNAEHTASYADLYSETNHPGADVRIHDVGTGDVLHEYQLKATDSASYVREHFDRYPGVDALVTEETAQHMVGVHSSGIENAAITEKVNDQLEALANNTLADRLEHSAEYATLVAGGRGLIDMLTGQKAFPQAVAETARKAGMATAATAITAFLFS